MERGGEEAKALWWGSAGLVLGVTGTSVVVAGAEHGGRLSVALALVLAQVPALRRLVRAPVAVLAATTAAGLAVWALLPAVTLTGALLAAQIALCVLSATGPRRVSAGALAAMCLPAPLGWVAGGPAGLTVYLLTVVLAWTAGQWRRAHGARIRAETRRAVAEERARIAREVHDVVAHTLSVMVVQAAAADDVFAERPDQARQALRAIETGARSALGELRLLLRAFGPGTQEGEDQHEDQYENENENEGEGEDAAGAERRTPSLARLDELAEAVRAAGMTVHVCREGAVDGLPAAVDLAGYRIVQEALTNALRHAAGADEVRVRVAADAAGVRLAVVDNGRKQQGGSGSSGPGRGLVGMRERARLVGGSLRAGPLPGGGFEVVALLPAEGVS
ncbi:histidine kinase [Streptomyces sp. NPDC013172]|uniref:sensor histidine kinase n=1 Tax=Streptomyces sp. NPDC013172 TaxID=3155009 RepID=UPI0033DC46DE